MTGRLLDDLALDPLKHVSIVDGQVTRAEVARITKFGIEGTDMAGHEYLPDGQIAAIADYVSQQRQSGGKLAER